MEDHFPPVFKSAHTKFKILGSLSFRFTEMFIQFKVLLVERIFFLQTDFKKSFQYLCTDTVMPLPSSFFKVTALADIKPTVRNCKLYTEIE